MTTAPRSVRANSALTFGPGVAPYASLLSAGTPDYSGPPNVRYLSIRGEGTIFGGGGALARAMIAAHAMRSRGRLICLMNCADVEIPGLTLEEAPRRKLHYIYSQNLTRHDLTVNNHVTNGDRLDPDSSKNSYISNCAFSTGDDCIAIKSGKNSEGNIINQPTKNVRIFSCRFTRGHGISFGSDTPGGIRHVIVEITRSGHVSDINSQGAKTWLNFAASKISHEYLAPRCSTPTNVNPFLCPSFRDEMVIRL